MSGFSLRTRLTVCLIFPIRTLTNVFLLDVLSTSVTTRHSRSQLHSALAAPSVRTSEVFKPHAWHFSRFGVGLSREKTDLRSSLLTLGIVEASFTLLSLTRSLRFSEVCKSGITMSERLRSKVLILEQQTPPWSTQAHTHQGTFWDYSSQPDLLRAFLRHRVLQHHGRAVSSARAPQLFYASLLTQVENVFYSHRESRKPYSFLLRDNAKKAKYAKTYISFFRIYFFFSHFSDSI